MRRNRIVVGSCLVLCFALGLAFDRYAGRAFRDYFGVSAGDFVRSPLAHWRVHQRDWGSLQALHYTKDSGGEHLGRNVETTLLPLIIGGKRLSDSYPVPKLGGAITVIGATVIILDRLGGLHRYDLMTGSFGALPGIPRLPNGLEAYLAHRPGPPVNLAEARNDEFRARGITFLPDRKQLAVAYDKFDETIGQSRTVVSVIPLDVAALTATGDWQQVFASDAFGYGQGIIDAGGVLAYHGDGKLYLTLGDHYITDPKVSEDPSSTFGKILEIDLATSKWRAFTKGHRNPEGLTFLSSGQLFSTEHGPRGGDELNVITEGSDYGWPNVTLGTDYDSYDWDPGTSLVGRHVDYKAPLFAWVPSVAPSQLIEITGFHPRWDGDLLVGSLKAESLYRLRLEAGRVLYAERIWIGQRVRDLAQANDGTIILWTDDTQLLSITVDTDQLVSRRRTPHIVGNTVVSNSCLGCHHFGPTNPTDFAPSLSNLIDRPIASDTYRYSPALRAKQKLGSWTPALLTDFLSDPSKFATGTTMVPLKVSSEDIKDIIATLARASDASSGSAPSR